MAGHRGLTAGAALITGGSSGIGLELAKGLAARGYRLALVARDEDRLRQAAEACRNISNAEVLIFSADVTEEDLVQRAVAAAADGLGGLDLLITSAGMACAERFDRLQTDDFHRTMAVNYFGTLHAVRAAMPYLERSAEARIVMISSGAGLVGLFGYGAYAPPKFAVRGLAEALRMELKPKGISVHAAYPPDTDTPQLQEENKTKPPETAAINAGAGLYSAERVARDILIGVDKGRFAITTGLATRLLLAFHSLLAPLLFRQFDATVAKVQAQDTRPDHGPGGP